MPKETNFGKILKYSLVTGSQKLHVVSDQYLYCYKLVHQIIFDLILLFWNIHICAIVVVIVHYKLKETGNLERREVSRPYAQQSTKKTHDDDDDGNLDSIAKHGILS